MVHGPLFAAGTLHHIDDEIAGGSGEGVEVVVILAGEADDRAGDENALQVGAAVKAELDGQQPFRENEVRKAQAVLECVGVERGGGTAVEVDALQAGAVLVKGVAQGLDAALIGDIRQVGAAFEKAAADGGDGGGDGDLREAGVIKGVAAQLHAGGGDLDVGQVRGLAEAAGPDLVDGFAVDGGGDRIGRGGIAAGIGDKCQILILILRFAVLHPRPKHDAILREVIGIGRIDFDLRHAAAALKHIAGDILGNGGDGAFRQFGAIHKSGNTDGQLGTVLGIGKEDLLQVGAALKGAVADFLDTARDGDGSDFFVPLERFARNGGDGVGDDDVAAGAVVAQKHTVLNVCADEFIFLVIRSVGTGDHGKDHAEAQQERGKAAPEGLDRVFHAVPPI